MRRFLVVGCGGSGGKTVAYLMDQLQADLREFGISKLPRGWSFVHIDVPVAEEPGPQGMGNVAQQGGRYLGLAPAGGSYPMLDHALSTRLQSAQALGSIATWAPREPQQVQLPISVGAGQYRAVGRMITLSRLSAVHAALDSAWQGLQSVEVHGEMDAISSRAPSVGKYKPGNPPVVLVISSMAGGSGASMALDVCRTLSMIPGIDPALTGLFAFSADVFDSLPAASNVGVRPNALAMFGEVLAAQTAAASAHDESIARALGVEAGHADRAPFARVFPVGRFMGIGRTPFGSGTMAEIYRGLGRGLAALMISGTAATEDFVSYDLGNGLSPAGDPQSLGWGVQWDPLPWAGFGSASLSMGRDRYAEYAAQRLAKASVDRLLRGHLQPGNTAQDDQQIALLLDSQWPSVLEAIGLPDRAAGGRAGEWFATQALPRHQADRLAKDAVQTQVVGHLHPPDNQQPSQWLSALRAKLAERRTAVQEATGRAARDWGLGWQNELVDRIETVVSQAVSRFGIPYAVALCSRIAQVMDVTSEDLTVVAQSPASDPTGLTAEFTAVVSGMKGVISNGHLLMDRLLTSLNSQVSGGVLLAGAGLAARITAAASSDVVPRLIATLAEKAELLRQASAAANTFGGLAHVATDHVPSWPTESDLQVDKRFDRAVNEVLLTSSAEYQDQFRSDAVRAVYGDAGGTVPAGVAQAATQIVSGQWETADGTLSPDGLIETRTPWRSTVFPVGSDGTPVIPSLPIFDLHVRPEELLGRAKMWVERTGFSFRRFCDMSLRSYAFGDDLTEHGKPGRTAEVADKFRQALKLGLPLTGVNENVVQMAHGTGVVYRYKFSTVPFIGLSVEPVLKGILDDDPLIDSSTTQFGFPSALSADDQVKRIYIFGSYQNYTPLAFDGVLEPAMQQLASTPAAGRETYWKWRRSRPLPAALPMGDHERRAMVAGWFVGQVVGRIRFERNQDFDVNPVEIYDSEAGRWAPFPRPMLTARNSFRESFDLLPAVLESSLLAMARAHHPPVLSSMRPYQQLRWLFDNNATGPVGQIDPRHAEMLLREWLQTGVTPTGGRSRAVADSATTWDERLQGAQNWLREIQALASEDFLATGEVIEGGDVATGGGRFSSVPTRAVASRVPIFRDLAADVYWAVTLLDQTMGRLEPVTPSRGGSSRTVDF